ncbi:MAG: DUF5658 family protein [Candidatus Cloacimonetes bacterium]|nr:DUF5658 family protein [Candidatus Cloacimonadota bacterium]
MLVTLFSLYGALVVLNILDGVSTWIVVRPNHYHRERNPLARWIFTKLGITKGIILSETLWIGFISGIFFLLFRHPFLSSVLLILLCLGVLIFLQVVSGNFRAWQKIRQREDLLAAKPPNQDNDVERA